MDSDSSSIDVRVGGQVFAMLPEPYDDPFFTLTPASTPPILKPFHDMSIDGESQSWLKDSMSVQLD